MTPVSRYAVYTNSPDYSASFLQQEVSLSGRILRNRFILRSRCTVYYLSRGARSLDSYFILSDLCFLLPAVRPLQEIRAALFLLFLFPDRARTSRTVARTSFRTIVPRTKGVPAETPGNLFDQKENQKWKAYRRCCKAASARFFCELRNDLTLPVPGPGFFGPGSRRLRCKQRTVK